MAEVRAVMATVSRLTGDLPAIRLTVAMPALHKQGERHAVTIPHIVLRDEGGVMGRLSIVGLSGGRELGVGLSRSRLVGLGLSWSRSWDSA